MILFLEGRFQIDAFAVGGLKTVLDQRAVGIDVEAPFAEAIDLALFLGNHNRRLRCLHPRQLPLPVGEVLLVGRLHQLLLQRRNSRFPVLVDQRVHANARHLVDAHQHRLPALPARRVVRHEIRRDRLQPLLRRDDVVFALKLLFEPFSYVGIVQL